MKYMLLLLVAAVCAACLNASLSPAEYYAEPAGLPYAETILDEKTEDDWRWTEFRYTSLVREGVPMRIHALYAVPTSASAENKVPAVVLTHGKFGAIKTSDSRYWNAVRDLVKAGYAVLFFAWNPDLAIKAGPLPEGAPEPRYPTFGPLDYSKEWLQSGDDWRDSLFYQTMMAGRRAISWVEARPEVDATRIGATGASFGGIFSSLLAAIDPRIKAVAPTVYAAGFGSEEIGYNRLSPKKFSEEQVREIRERFDSEVLLAARPAPVPILYSVTTNDAAFTILKAARHYAALPEPKQILIAPNEGHGFWNFGQTVRFFNRELQGKGTRPSVGAIRAERSDGGWRLSVKSDATRVEFFHATEPPPDLTARPGQQVQPAKWKWQKLPAAGEPGGYAATLVAPEAAREGAGAVHVFARARDASGTEACSPLLTLDAGAR